MLCVVKNMMQEFISVTDLFEKFVSLSIVSHRAVIHAHIYHVCQASHVHVFPSFESAGLDRDTLRGELDIMHRKLRDLALPLCLSHGDCHVNNIVYNEDKREANPNFPNDL